MKIPKSKLRRWKQWRTDRFASFFHWFQLLRLRLNRQISEITHPRSFRILATACWNFPIYSQTFVYQELTQLIRKGFPMCFLYTKQDSRKQLPAQFDPLWRCRFRMTLDLRVCRKDQEYFERKIPDKVRELIELICRHSGMSEEELRAHHHFQEAFVFTRMVEAYRPKYIHSYFFYEGTLFAFIASFLLNIPRGVSCYADHNLQDYELKLVPLHLQQSSVIVATSYQIKQELLRILPTANPNHIIVKPNAINTTQFPIVNSPEPTNGQPYRLVSVSRIEPKKGLIFLAEAVRNLKDRGLNVQWHVVGDVDGGISSKEYAHQLKKRIQELGIVDSVQLEGMKSEDEIKRIFQQSHIFVAPFVQTEHGDKDGIPTSLLEGMASGLPVVATDAGSIPEVIDNGTDGILVTQRSPELLANAISDLLVSSQTRAQLSQNAARKIRDKFDVSVCETSFHESIQKIVSKRDNQVAISQNKPLVSVVIIFYNAQLYLEEAIESVFAQTYGNWELLLADDGSTDGSTQTAKRYSEKEPFRVRYLEHEGHQNHGMSATRNLAVRNAKGEYIAFIDADDYWFPNKLERQVAILESEPNAHMVYGATEYWYGWTNQPEDLAKDYIPELGVPHETVFDPPTLIPLLHPFGLGTAPCPSDLMIRRKTIEELGGFEEHFRGKYQFFEDQAFLAKMYLNYPVYVSSECWDKHRYHPESCHAVVTNSGESDSVRLYFLEWFEKYLMDRGIKEGPVWSVVQRDLIPFRNPSFEQIDTSGSLQWGSFRRLSPVSPDWGFDRGMPIDRYYIELFLNQHSKDIHDRTLEIEDDMYTSRFGGNRTTIRDVLHVEEGNPRATIVGELTSASHIPSNQFQCIVLTQTLQLIYDTHAAIHTLHRILKPGGVLLATFPGITRISTTEWSGSWYWSFTSASAQRLFEESFGSGNVEVQVYGNVLTATGFLQGVAAEELKKEELEYHDPNYELLLAVRAVKHSTK